MSLSDSYDRLVLWEGETQQHQFSETGEEEEEVSLLQVDEHLSAGDILNRIELVVGQLVEDIATSEAPPTLQMASRAKRHIVCRDEGPSAFEYGCTEAGIQVTNDPWINRSRQAVVLGLQDRVQTRCLFSNQAAGAFPFARMFRVLEVVHELLRSGRQATQRDIYYKLSGPPLFNSVRDVISAIQDVVALLRVPRSLLGICCSSRGAVSGKLYIKDGPMNPWQDCCAAGMEGRSISGNILSIQSLIFRCTAEYLLIIEKDAIFQALNQDRFFDQLPCVLVTAKGMPDLATRAFCSKLMDSFPHLTVLGLVDWNPAGVAILCTYKYGSTQSLEGNRYTLPSLAWLGLRSNLLTTTSRENFQALNVRDRAQATGLMTKLQMLREEAWCHELKLMESTGLKADIEAIYDGPFGMAGLTNIISSAIMRREFV
ncbi:hypothetical protein CEUSTIGMA_g1097.t1 [Chlamydomonas eustigma]|uniref:DNA topoisomerase (ATP-hydrolyzing) n=1 Tax=Chlamydomonas eustigma TaxID=1157962 RepID=A0A250WSE9_9CHLO|nr:hypothetical protein CEUSTIGMA_g1097.t1 [Chlamydomonas eustigma]|eukprot:GAX73646.1 hypothetical protein CEUSTIGMA_g1097.t1 [Chlamydomonas eustigma]